MLGNILETISSGLKTFWLIEAAPEEILEFTLTTFHVLDQSNLYLQARSLDASSEHCPEVK